MVCSKFLTLLCIQCSVSDGSDCVCIRRKEQLSFPVHASKVRQQLQSATDTTSIEQLTPTYDTKIGSCELKSIFNASFVTTSTGESVAKRAWSCS
jgi:citrate lyase synthetase